MKRIIIPVLLCVAAILVVAAAQNVRANASTRVTSSPSARSGIASLKVSVARGKCEILRAAASEVESLGAPAARGAAKNIVHRVAKCQSAIYDTAPRREMVPVKWTRGCFTDPAESSHVVWDRGKRTEPNLLEHLDEDSRLPARLPSSGRSGKCGLPAENAALTSPPAVLFPALKVLVPLARRDSFSVLPSDTRVVLPAKLSNVLTTTLCLPL